MKKLLLVFALITLFSCSQENVTPSNGIKADEFYISLENKSQTNNMTIDMFYSPTGKSADNKYIFKGRQRKSKWDTTFVPMKGKGSLYVQASRPVGDTSVLVWVRKMMPNYSKLDTGSCKDCKVNIVYDPNR